MVSFGGGAQIDATFFVASRRFASPSGLDLNSEDFGSGSVALGDDDCKLFHPAARGRVSNSRDHRGGAGEPGVHRVITQFFGFRLCRCWLIPAELAESLVDSCLHQRLANERVCLDGENRPEFVWERKKFCARRSNHLEPRPRRVFDFNDLAIGNMQLELSETGLGRKLSPPGFILIDRDDVTENRLALAIDPPLKDGARRELPLADTLPDRPANVRAAIPDPIIDCDERNTAKFG